VTIRKALTASVSAILFSLTFALPASAASKADVEKMFRAWIDNDLWPAAQKTGVSEKTFRAAMEGVTLNWDLPDLVPPGSKPKKEQAQSQAEFSTLRRIEQKFGVPGEIVVAVWGRESGFGSAKIPYSAVEVLATKAFMSTRKDLFRKELIAALHIVDGGDRTVAQLKGSWAGALGQPQFMPTKYLTTAVDFDGDGRRDIWESVPDVLASIANYLKQNGWEPGVGWGVEVVLPAGVACSLEGPDQGKPLAQWEAMGIRTVDGKPLAGRNGKRIGHLMMPAGRHGPAFIVSKNFYILKTYNNSDLYALFIGHLADRIRGGGAIRGTWDDVGGFKRSDVRSMQERLTARGVDVGNVDGLVGYKTRIAIGEWQQANGRADTCFPDAALLKAIR
jgi:lytic murein transglycosylase